MISVEDLSADQRVAYDAIMRWVEARDREVLTMGGFAGSGKSTLVSLVAEQVDLPAFCAYTGKASSVLRRKLAAAGVETVGAQPRGRDGAQSLESRPYCGTIHSLIYRPCSCREPQAVEILKPCPEKKCVGETRWVEGRSVCTKGHVGLVKTEKAFNALEPAKRFVYAQKGPDGTCTLCGGKEWLRREMLDRSYGLIIVDEASMVDDGMLRDLRSYGVPILAVGDHGQLPPVGGTGSLMRSPDLRLEKIHRQAEGNPIIALSKMIREEGRLPESMPPNDAVTFGRLRQVDALTEERYADATPERLLEMGLVCYTNRRRLGLNTAVRRARGTARIGRELPRKGEHVVCLRNIKAQNGRPPVANGMRGVLVSDAGPKAIFNRHGQKVGESEAQIVGSVAFPEDEIDAAEYEMLRAQFGREKTFSSPEELARETGLHSFQMAGALFDFGWAMTVHKCVAPDTLVETPGGLTPIGLLPSRWMIATPRGRQPYRNRIRNLPGPMLRVLTNDGYELRCTPDHGVDVWAPEAGYVRREAKEIRPGDIVRLRLGAEFKDGTRGEWLPEGQPQDVRARSHRLPKFCTGDAAEFFGLMVADGTVYRKGFRLAKRHRDVADRFDYLCRRLFGATPSRFYKLNAHHVEVSSALVADWLRDVGGMGPNAKSVPDCVLAASLKIQARFLRGLFEDGTVNLKGGKLDHIEFVSSVPELRRTVRTMLLRFGIVSGATDRRPTSVYIYGAYAKLFGERIGFVSKFKQSRLSAPVPEGTRYVFPLRSDELHLPGAKRGVIQRHRAPKKAFADRAPFHHSTVKSVSRYRGESVCVEVPNGNQFIQDGFCGWNCQGSQFDDLVVLAERPGPVDEESWRRWLYTAVTRAAKKLTVLR